MRDEENLLPVNQDEVLPGDDIWTDNRHPPLAIFDAIYGRSRNDAVIALGSLRPGRNGEIAPRYLCPLRVSDRHSMLPTLFEYCVSETQYICPNTLHESAMLGKPYDSFMASLQQHGRPEYFRATNDHVYELCAITIDLDVGRNKDDLSPGEAFGCVIDACLRREMVWPSLVALSGRGGYLMFLLREETSMSPPLATDDNRACWKLITNDMLTRLEHLKADHNAKRFVNWYKRPGTFDFKTGNEVVYMTLGVDDLANVPIYKLSSLMRRLNLHHAPEPQPLGAGARLLLPAPTKPERSTILMPTASDMEKLKQPIRKVQPGKGSEPYKRRAAEIEMLSQLRRGIPEGLRTITLFHYFQARRAYLSMIYRLEQDGGARAHAEALDAAHRLNRTFRPPLSPREVDKACRTKSNRRMAKSTTIAGDLHVKPEEVEKLGLVSIMPDAMKATAKAQDEKIKSKNRQFKEARHNLVDKMIGEGKSNSEIMAEVERVLLSPITRQFVNNRRKRIAAMTPPEWFQEEA